MRVILVHNRYQRRGGEESVYEDEARLLEEAGYLVDQLEWSNDEVEGTTGALRAGAAAIWSPSSRKRIREAVIRARADVVHFHNTFPLVSPAGYFGAIDGGAAVVQTLHNYRLLCAGGMLLRDGKVCTDCVGKRVGLAGIANKCYRGSLLGSCAVTAVQSIHRELGTWKRAVGAFIALTNFQKKVFVESGGFDAARIQIVPNFAFRPVAEPDRRRSGVLFVGRLSEEKGVRLLLDVWRGYGAAAPSMLTIVGDGPLRVEVEAAARETRSISFLGPLESPRVAEEMKGAEALIVPSLWFEGLPRVIVESFAVGTPAIVADIGALSELVEEGKTGSRFTAGDADALKAAVARTLGGDPLTESTRASYDEKFAPEVHLRELLGVYEEARQRQALRR